MIRQFPITTRRFWKLGGFTALALSTLFTVWIMGSALGALGQLMDTLVAFIDHHAPAWLPDHSPFTG